MCCQLGKPSIPPSLGFHLDVRIDSRLNRVCVHRSIQFFTYGNGKLILAENFNGGKEASWVHLLAATNAGSHALSLVSSVIDRASDKRRLIGLCDFFLLDLSHQVSAREW